MNRTALLALLVSLAFVVAACGSPDEPPPPAEDRAAAPAAEPADEAPADDDGVARVRIGSNDQMQFDTREFTVRAGQQVELTLEHTGRMPVGAMGHNVVIIQPGLDVMAFGSEALQQGASRDNQYVPEAVRDRVIAFTDIIGGGETTSITFTAPDEPGEYPFLCSFPGHFGSMNGKMVVR